MQNLELTQREKKIAIRCVAQYKKLLFRNGKIIGWAGVIIFGLGIIPVVSLPDWIKMLSSYTGVFMVIHSVFAEFITVIGKLYERHVKIESKDESG